MVKRGRDDNKGPDNKAYGAVNKAGEVIPSEPIERPAITVPRKERMHVVAWNLNGMRAFMTKRSGELAALWKAEDVDVLGITETKITDTEKATEIEQLVRECLKSEKVEFVWSMCKLKKGYSGSLAIIRKSVYDDIKKISFGIKDGVDDPEGRVITLEFKNDLNIVIAYVPNSGQNLERLSYRTSSWDKDFSKHCCGLKGKVLVAGDLNVAHRDVDIWNVDAPHVPKGAGTTPQERYSFETQLLDKGFVDTFASMHPDKQGWFTYHSIRARNKPKNRGLRLDYVLAARATVLDAFITCDYAADGDHCPVGVVVHI